MAKAIEVTNNTHAHRFEARVDGELAFADYNLLHDAVVFPHTEVPKALEGRGVATALIKAGLAFARAKGLKVKPICPFVAAYMARHPETHDLVHKEFRVRLGLEPE
ncbi:MAG: GNAT family N-acetyltransferase [Phenylobacterium sp.]